MAASTWKFLLPNTEFLDTEIAPAKNKGNNIDSKCWLNGWDLWCVCASMYLF